MNFITIPLRWILDTIYGFVGNYGVAIMLFTLVVKLILLPLDIKQRSSMYKTQKIQPMLEEINRKYEKDPEKKNQKTMELYKKEHINPMAGCLPILIQFPILFAMFAVMRHIAAEQVVEMVETVAAGNTYIPQSFLWIRNIWQPDNISARVIPDLNAIIGTISTVKKSTVITPDIIATIKANYEVVMKPMMELYNTGVANGWAILPILAGGSQYFTTWLMNGQQKNGPASQQQQQQKLMSYMFPIITVFFCWQYNAAFAVYWVTSNAYTIVTYVLFNVIEKKKEKKQALANK